MAFSYFMNRSFIFLNVIIIFFATCDQVTSAKGNLEINYEGVSYNFYHAEGSNAVYGPTGTHITLRCMLPSSASQATQLAERDNILWKKDRTDIVCAKIDIKDACDWADPSTTTPRGEKRLKVITTDSEDNLKQAFAGSGTFTCYHANGEGAYRSADVRVWVAGTLLEITVNAVRLEKRLYQLPEKSVSEMDRKTVVLDCIVTSTAKTPEKPFVWYRNEQRVMPSGRFTFNDTYNRRLEIKNAGSGDGGVYMCEADLEQAGKPITSRQYIVLKGDPTSMAASNFNRWQNLLQSILIFIFIWSIIR